MSLDPTRGPFADDDSFLPHGAPPRAEGDTGRSAQLVLCLALLLVLAVAACLAWAEVR